MLLYTRKIFIEVNTGSMMLCPVFCLDDQCRWIPAWRKRKHLEAEVNRGAIFRFCLDFKDDPGHNRILGQWSQSVRWRRKLHWGNILASILGATLKEAGNPFPIAHFTMCDSNFDKSLPLDSHTFNTTTANARLWIRLTMTLSAPLYNTRTCLTTILLVNMQ